MNPRDVMNLDIFNYFYDFFNENFKKIAFLFLNLTRKRNLGICFNTSPSHDQSKLNEPIIREKNLIVSFN